MGKKFKNRHRCVEVVKSDPVVSLSAMNNVLEGGFKPPAQKKTLDQPLSSRHWRLMFMYMSNT